MAKRAASSEQPHQGELTQGEPETVNRETKSGGAIFAAIPAILADVDAIGKTRKNQQQGYSFRGIDDVYNAIHPLLATHKVFPTCEIISRELTERETKNGGVLFYVNIKARYTLWAHDGSCVTTEAWGEAMDSGDKASNKAMSAAYKYALFQLLCIPTEAVDSEEETHQDVKPRAKRVAEEHRLTTADQLLPPVQKTIAELASDAISESVKKKDLKALNAIELRIRERHNEGKISEGDYLELGGKIADAEEAISKGLLV